MRNLANEAADWYIRLSEPISDNDLRQWVEWCAADPEHLREFERVRETWKGFSALAEPLEARLNELDEKYRPVGSWRRIARSAAGIIVTLAILVFGSIHFFKNDSTYTSEVGEVRTITLGDGSTLTLNTNSRVTVAYSSHRREITVDRGQALFRVAKDRLRPFRVYANSATVTALGTTFLVSNDRYGTAVTLFDGRVAVEDYAPGPVQKVINRLSPAAPAPDPQSLILAPGQRLTVNGRGKHSPIESVAPAALDRQLAWRDGRLVYLDTPLSQVVTDVSRYLNRPIEITDPTISNISYSGTIFTQSIDDWLKAVETTFPVSVEAKPDRIILRSRRP
jgi:transmembrane sensor